MAVVAAPPTQQYDAQTLASNWLVALGWPNTAANRQALASWFLAESAHGSVPGSVVVVGNNPLNIANAPGTDYRNVGTHHIAVFSTPEAGISGFQQRIGLPNHGYPAIVSGFQAGTGQAAITAIINSEWVTGKPGSYNHYVHNGSGGGHETNLLQDIYNGIPNSATGATGATDTLATVPVPLDYISFLKKYYPSDTPISPDTYTFSSNDVKFIGELISVSPNAKPMDKQWLAQEQAFIASLTAQEGKPASQVIIPVDQLTILGATASSANAFNTGAAFDPLGIGAALHGAAATFIAKSAAMGAILGGGALVLFGLYLVTKEATNSGSADSLVSPVPVFLREGA